jgi:hypothetical protein
MKCFLVLCGLLFQRLLPWLMTSFSGVPDNHTRYFTEIKTQKLIKEETTEEALFLKMDLANDRCMSHKDSQWDEAEMADRA